MQKTHKASQRDWATDKITNIKLTTFLNQMCKMNKIKFTKPMKFLHFPNLFKKYIL